jgi:hypothetical protein
MITLGPTRVALIAIAAAWLPAAAVVGAAEPTLSDIAGCNQQAAQKTGASALPAPPGAPGREIAKGTPDDRRDARELPARGGIPAAGAPGASVSKPGAGAAATGEKTDPSGSVITESRDPLLKGMDAEKANDPAYRAAYRDCIRAKTAR